MGKYSRLKYVYHRFCRENLASDHDVSALSATKPVGFQTLRQVLASVSLTFHVITSISFNNWQFLQVFGCKDARDKKFSPNTAGFLPIVPVESYNWANLCFSSKFWLTGLQCALAVGCAALFVTHWCQCQLAIRTRYKRMAFCVAASSTLQLKHKCNLYANLPARGLSWTGHARNQ